MHQKQNIVRLFDLVNNFTYTFAENGETSFVTNNIHETTDSEMALLSLVSATDVFIHTLEDFSVCVQLSNHRTVLSIMPC
jgi:hypothetical protein